ESEVNSGRDEYLAQTTPASRVLSTNRPGICYVIGAVMAAGAIPIAVFGPWPASVVGAVMMVLFGTVAALPGWWSDHHRELANRTVAARLDQRDIAMRRHPVRWVVIVALAVGFSFAGRITADSHHPTVGLFIFAAVVAVG